MEYMMVVLEEQEWDTIHIQTSAMNPRVVSWFLLISITSVFLIQLIEVEKIFFKKTRKSRPRRVRK